MTTDDALWDLPSVVRRAVSEAIKCSRGDCRRARKFLGGHLAAVMLAVMQPVLLARVLHFHSAPSTAPQSHDCPILNDVPHHHRPRRPGLFRARKPRLRRHLEHGRRHWADGLAGPPRADAAGLTAPRRGRSHVSSGCTAGRRLLYPRHWHPSLLCPARLRPCLARSPLRFSRP
jgi:hypothetical protein